MPLGELRSPQIWIRAASPKGRALKLGASTDAPLGHNGAREASGRSGAARHILSELAVPEADQGASWEEAEASPFPSLRRLWPDGSCPLPVPGGPRGAASSRPSRRTRWTQKWHAAALGAGARARPRPWGPWGGSTTSGAIRAVRVVTGTRICRAFGTFSLRTGSGP